MMCGMPGTGSPRPWTVDRGPYSSGDKYKPGRLNRLPGLHLRSTVHGPRSALRDPQLNIPIHDPHRVSRDIHHRRQHGGLAGAHVELAAVARADNGMVFELPIAQRPVVVRAHVADGKIL